MIRLNTEEIKQMADALCMTEQEAQEVADIFVDIFIKEQNGKYGWKVGVSLESVDDYIREWENHWHREMNWQEYYDYEKAECLYEYGNNREKEIFETVESFKEYVQNNVAYELKCNNMIIVVC